MSTRGMPDQAGDLPRIGRPATGALLAAGIDSLAGVAAPGRRELLALHGVGPKAAGILDAAIAERGLAWREDGDADQVD